LFLRRKPGKLKNFTGQFQFFSFRDFFFMRL